MAHPVRWPRPAVAVAVAVAVAGCSTTVSGSVAQTTEPAGSGVDFLQLDAGNYPTKPQPPLGHAGDATNAAIIEGRRMAGYVVGPWEIDPAMSKPSWSTGVSKGSGRIGTLLDDDEEVIGTAANAHNLITSFASNRSGADKNWLLNMVLRFPTPDDAAAAATDMAAASTSLKVPWTDAAVPHDPIPIPRYPDTSAVIKTAEDHVSLHAYTAHGMFVLCQYVGAADADRAAGLVADTLDREGPRLDQFEPTPADQLLDLPTDPEGLMARTLPPDPDAGPNFGQGIYDGYGRLHWMYDAPHFQSVFDATGMQLSSQGRADVYQTRDAAAATKLVDDLVTQLGGTPAAGVKGLPAAKCLADKDSTSTTFTCVTAVDRYAIAADSIHEIEAHQKLTAQYLILTTR